MKNTFKKILPALYLSLAFPVVAQDAAPVNPAQILQELKDILNKNETAASSRQQQMMDRVFKAAASKETALAFYEEAQMATQFQGVSRENTQLRDWKKKNEEQLKDPAFRESIRLHLFWLGLSLKQAAGAKPEEMLPRVSSYLDILEKAEGAIEVKGSLLKQSVAGGIFANWLGLGPDLAKAKNWEMNPGKYDAIATKILLPEWRKTKNPAVLKYWDGRIAREGLAAGDASRAFEQNKFNSITKPSLLWDRAKEYVALGQPNRAVTEMFGLIKTYPTHPDVANWITELQKMLTHSPAAPSPAAEAAP